MLVFVFSNTSTQVPKRTPPEEQTVFGAEDEHWFRQVPVPEEVLRILREVNQSSADEFPADSLLASEIHLRDAQEADLILMGIHILRLPHAALFWIFRKTRDRFELILSTGGDMLTVLDAKSNGYRRIRVENNTASTTTTAIYSFNGREYRLSKKETKPI